MDLAAQSFPVGRQPPLNLTGAKSVAPEGTITTLPSSSSIDTNSITEPTKIVPVITKAKGTKAKGLSNQFRYTFASYSVTVLVLSTQ